MYVRMYVCMYIATGYNDVTVIPSGARHVSVMDDSTSGNIFIGKHMHVCGNASYVCITKPAL